MIKSKMPRLKLDKEEKESRKITYDVLRAETGLAPSTLANLLKIGSTVERIDGKTLSTLCNYFQCQVGDLLEYVPD